MPESRPTLPAPSAGPTGIRRQPGYRRRTSGRSVLVLGAVVSWLVVMVGSSSAFAATPAAATTAAVPPSAASGNGWIRFGHFVPASGPVDVTVNGTTIGTNLSFRDVTNYVAVPAGPATVVLASAAAPTTPIISGQTTIVAGGATTVAAVASTGSAITLQMFSDDLTAPAAGMAKVRVIHTVPGVSSITASLTADVTTAATSAAVAAPTPLTLPPVGYGQASAYASVAAGTYQVVLDGPTGTPVVSGTNWPVAAGTVASIVVVSAPTGPTLEVLSDAIGTANAPTGGMQTGLGGTAQRPGSLFDSVAPPAAAAAAVALGAGVILRTRRQRARAGRRPNLLRP